VNLSEDRVRRPLSGTAGAAGEDVVHLRRGGTSVLLRLGRQVLPCILHWGPDLGDVTDGATADLVAALSMPAVDSVISSQEAVAVLPQHSSGWLGRPGLLGSRAGAAWSVAFDDVEHLVEEAGTAAWPDGATGSVRLRSVGSDLAGELTTGRSPTRSCTWSRRSRSRVRPVNCST
jgi:alpha-galactosidase